MSRSFGKWEREDGFLGEQGYYKIPSQPNLAIKPTGEVFSKSRLWKLDNKFNEYVDVNHDRTTYKLHNFLAEAFVEVPEELADLERSKLIANHKNGNKHDFSIDNLEWTSYTGNILHAYKTGLRTDNNRTQAKNVFTGEVFDFYSQAECARFFGVDPVNVLYWLKESKAFRTSKGFFIFRAGDQNWPIVPDEGLKAKQSDIFAKTIHPNGNSYLFTSIKQAAVFLGLDSKSLASHIRRNGKKPYNGFEFQRLYDKEQISGQAFETITGTSPPKQ